jgi:hypothetical protein
VLFQKFRALPAAPPLIFSIDHSIIGPDFLLDFLERHDTGRPIQLPLPMVI